MFLRSVLLLVVCLAVGGSAAQTPSEESRPLFDARNKKYESSMEKLYQERSVLRTSSPQVLEGTIDPQVYIVGPGDRFSIFIWGRAELFDVEVNPMGTVVIPTVGEIRIGGASLRASLERIATGIRKKYDNVQFSANLTRLRKFRIYVAGEVRSHGTFFVQGSDRLSDVIDVVGGVSRWGNDTAIEIRHKEEGTDTVDLSSFYVSGDLSQNPTLRGGDLVYVPPIRLNEDHVFFEGKLAEQQEKVLATNRTLRPDELPSELQGIFPLKKNENLPQFLARIGAIEKNSDLERVMVVREGEEIIFNLTEPEGMERFFVFVLQHQDRIVIRDRRDRVYVRGDVRQPGAYPFLTNRTVSDYAGMAGVMDTGASPDHYEVIRVDSGEKLKGKNTVVRSGDTVIVPLRRRETVKDYMRILLPVATLLVSVAALTSR